MDEANDQRQQRIKKLEELRSLGVNPFGTHFEVTDRAGQLIQLHGKKTKEELERAGLRCRIAGRIVALRRFGKAAFALVQDGADRVQVYLKKDTLGEHAYRICVALDVGDWIGVSGLLFRTKTDEFTVDARELTFLSKALRPLPEKWHGLTDVETRYRQRYVDLIANPAIHEIFVTRSRIIGSMRTFLIEKGFLEVETPMMQSIPGGATARPFVTHHNALGMDLYLRVAPELYLKRLIVGGLPRVFEINRNFRNEGISTIHNPEFTMLEFYVAYADYTDLMTFTEELFTRLAQDVLGATTFAYQGTQINLTRPWRRLPRLHAIREVGMQENAHPTALLSLLAQYTKAGKKDAKLVAELDETFQKIVEPKLIQPTFITDYPTELSPLARRKDADPSLTDRFELYVAGREIANAFSELNDPLDQRQRFEAQVARRQAGDEEAHALDEDFLRALEYGMPPTAGEGIGIDRVVMLFTNQASIRDVILFPQLRPET